MYLLFDAWLVASTCTDVRESSFNMARGDEDIEGGLRKCLHAQRGAKWGSEDIVELGEEFWNFYYQKGEGY